MSMKMKTATASNSICKQVLLRSLHIPSSAHHYNIHNSYNHHHQCIKYLPIALRSSLASYCSGSVSLRSFSSSSNELLNRFENAINALKTLNTDPGTDIKIRLYALYKQATEGSCNTSRPSMFDFVATQKFDAWNKLNSMSKEDAMNDYINLISNITGATKSESTTSSAVPSPDIESNEYLLKQYAYPRQQQGLSSLGNHKFIKTEVSTGVVNITLNRPSKGNSFNMLMWKELRDTFTAVGNDSTAKVCILQSSSNHFSTGNEKCEGRKRESLSNIIQFYQDCVSSPESSSPVPVIAAINGFCIGGAIDLITACDMRYCTSDSSFSIKETDLAIVADIGTLQRLPKLIGDSQTRELAYTGRTFSGKEAEALGLVLKCFNNKEEMMDHVNKVAAQIASKSPLTIRGIKSSLLFARDNSVRESLQQVKSLNAAQLYSNDLRTAMMAHMKKNNPEYSDP